MNDVQILERAIKENPNDMATWGALHDAYLENGMTEFAGKAKKVLEDRSTISVHIDEVMKSDCNYPAWDDLQKELEATNPSISSIIRATRLGCSPHSQSRHIAYITSSVKPTKYQKRLMDIWVGIHNGDRRTRTISSEEVFEEVGWRISGETDKIIDMQCGAVSNSYGYRAFATGICGGVIKLRNRRWLVVLFGDAVSANGNCSMPLGNRSWTEYKKNMVPEFLARCCR